MEIEECIDSACEALRSAVAGLREVHAALYALDTATSDVIADEFEVAAVEVSFTLRELDGPVRQAKRFLAASRG